MHWLYGQQEHPRGVSLISTRVTDEGYCKSNSADMAIYFIMRCDLRWASAYPKSMTDRGQI